MHIDEALLLAHDMKVMRIQCFDVGCKPKFISPIAFTIMSRMFLKKMFLMKTAIFINTLY